MRKTILVTLLVLVPMSVQTIMAGPFSDSNSGGDYTVSWQRLSRWSFGAYSDGWIRKMSRFNNELNSTIESSKISGYVGYDVFDCLTVYLQGGGGDIGGKSYSTSQTERGIGLLWNAMDYELPDPTVLEDRIRINVGCQYSEASTKYRGSNLDWAEQTFWTTLSYVNDVEGNKFYLPNSISVFIGPFYSDLTSNRKVVAKKNWGYTAGLEMFYSECISMYFRTITFDDLKYCAGINVRL